MSYILNSTKETIQFNNQIETETVQESLIPTVEVGYDVSIDEGSFDVPEIPGTGDLGKTGDGVLDGHAGSVTGDFSPNPGSLDIDTGHSVPGGLELPGELDPTSTNGQSGTLGPNGLGSLGGIVEMPGATKGDKPVFGEEEFPGSFGSTNGNVNGAESGLEGIFDNPASGMENGPIENPATAENGSNATGTGHEFLPNFGGDTAGSFDTNMGGSDFESGADGWSKSTGQTNGDFGSTDTGDLNGQETGHKTGIFNHESDPNNMVIGGRSSAPTANNTDNDWVSNEDRYLFGGWEKNEQTGQTTIYYTSEEASDSKNNGTYTTMTSAASATDSKGHKTTVVITHNPEEFEVTLPSPGTDTTVTDSAATVLNVADGLLEDNGGSKPSAKKTDGEYHGGTASVEDILNGMGKDQDPLILTIDEDTIDTSNLGDPAETVDSLNDLISLKDPEATSFGSMEPSLEYIQEIEGQLIQTVGTSHETVSEDAFM